MRETSRKRYAYDPAEPKHKLRGGRLMEPEHPDPAKASVAQKALKKAASYEDLFFLVVAVAERFVRISP